MATLRGDTNSVEMLKGLLHTKITEEDQPTRGTRCLPKFKRNPMKVNPSIYAVLSGRLPLTIFDKDWQEGALTYHVEKRTKSEDSSSDKVSQYSGLLYLKKWSQTYTSWSMNHKTFHKLLPDVYDLSVFAGWIRIHKQHVDNLHKHHGFMPAFRYDMMTRENTFSHRVYG
ncbi:hypothetical protein PGT21_017608 [Puccinia graminis f. sp. tritici]|uniref:Uncharacterized protein n=1 Tax=Puccinia graminis f. sp. tritici TaxID=56615 RepID=A0A5B0Q6H9_PUCGR|nr:hypothetical protein PGT21_017608 [Puccinia graminis f. sp. tritici]